MTVTNQVVVRLSGAEYERASYRLHAGWWSMSTSILTPLEVATGRIESFAPQSEIAHAH